MGRHGQVWPHHKSFCRGADITSCGGAALFRGRNGLQVGIGKQSTSPERLLLLTSRPRSTGREDGHDPGSVPSRLQSPALRSCRPPVLFG